jgi:hypothetical protein
MERLLNIVIDNPDLNRVESLIKLAKEYKRID